MSPQIQGVFQVSQNHVMHGEQQMDQQSSKDPIVRSVQQLCTQELQLLGPLMQLKGKKIKIKMPREKLLWFLLGHNWAYRRLQMVSDMIVQLMTLPLQGTAKAIHTSRNCTWNLEFGSFPWLAICHMILSQDAGQRQ